MPKTLDPKEAARELLRLMERQRAENPAAARAAADALNPDKTRWRGEPERERRLGVNPETGLIILDPPGPHLGPGGEIGFRRTRKERKQLSPPEEVEAARTDVREVLQDAVLRQLDEAAATAARRGDPPATSQEQEASPRPRRNQAASGRPGQTDRSWVRQANSLAEQAGQPRVPSFEEVPPAHHPVPWQALDLLRTHPGQAIWWPPSEGEEPVRYTDEDLRIHDQRFRGDNAEEREGPWRFLERERNTPSPALPRWFEESLDQTAPAIPTIDMEPEAVNVPPPSPDLPALSIEAPRGALAIAGPGTGRNSSQRDFSELTTPGRMSNRWIQEGVRDLQQMTPEDRTAEIERRRARRRSMGMQHSISEMMNRGSY